MSWDPYAYQIGDPLDARIDWNKLVEPAIKRTEPHEIPDAATDLVPYTPTRAIRLRQPGQPVPLQPEPWNEQADEKSTHRKLAPVARFWWEWAT